MRISYWSSNVCSSNLVHGQPRHRLASVEQDLRAHTVRHIRRAPYIKDRAQHVRHMRQRYDLVPGGQHRSHGVEIDFTVLRKRRDVDLGAGPLRDELPGNNIRSEEHTSELQSLMRISYAVFCLQKKTHDKTRQTNAH